MIWIKTMLTDVQIFAKHRQDLVSMCGKVPGLEYVSKFMVISHAGFVPGIPCFIS